MRKETPLKDAKELPSLKMVCALARSLWRCQRTDEKDRVRKKMLPGALLTERGGGRSKASWAMPIIWKQHISKSVWFCFEVIVAKSETIVSK